MSFMLAQIAGGLSTVAALICVQGREAKTILWGQFAANALSAACYGLLGSLAGAWVCILAAIQSLLISGMNRKAPRQRKKGIRLIAVLFSVAFVLGTVLTYSRWPDIISCICALLFVLTVSQEKAGSMRGIMILSMSLWLVFDIAVGAYAAILTHGATILSLLIACFRLDRKRPEKQ